MSSSLSRGRREWRCWQQGMCSTSCSLLLFGGSWFSCEVAVELSNMGQRRKIGGVSVGRIVWCGLYQAGKKKTAV